MKRNEFVDFLAAIAAGAIAATAVWATGAPPWGCSAVGIIFYMLARTRLDWMDR